MLQHWSVYDPIQHQYKVYTSNVADRHPSLGPPKRHVVANSDLGAAPSDVLSTLPYDAKFVGTSDTPQGRVALAGVTAHITSVAFIAAIGIVAWLVWRGVK